MRLTRSICMIDIKFVCKQKLCLIVQNKKKSNMIKLIICMLIWIWVILHVWQIQHMLCVDMFSQSNRWTINWHTNTVNYMQHFKINFHKWPPSFIPITYIKCGYFNLPSIWFLQSFYEFVHWQRHGCPSLAQCYQISCKNEYL